MREKLRIIFWVIVVKVALTKARWNSGGVKESGTAIGAPAIADRRALTRFDAGASPITDLTDDVIRRCFTRVLPRFWNFVKRIDHPDSLLLCDARGFQELTCR